MKLNLGGKIPSLPLLRTLHLAAHGVLRAAGYRFELRRSGEMKIGLWRKGSARATGGRGGRGSQGGGGTSGGGTRMPKRFVFVPGFGDTPLSWSIVLGMLRPLLRHRYDEVVLLDFPGFQGFLSREKSFDSMDRMMAAVDDVFDSLRPHTLMGHSLGGWLASRYAARCGAGERPLGNRKTYSGPDLLILANPAGVFGSDDEKRDYQHKYERVVKEGFEIVRPDFFAKEPLWFRLVVPEMSVFTLTEETIQFIQSVREEHLVEASLPQIRARTWLLWGEKDTLTPPTAITRWLKGAESPENRAEAVLIRGAGHSPQLEKPAVTAAVLAQILLHGNAESSTGKAPAGVPRLLKHAAAGRWWRVVAG